LKEFLDGTFKIILTSDVIVTAKNLIDLVQELQPKLELNKPAKGGITGNYFLEFLNSKTEKK